MIHVLRAPLRCISCARRGGGEESIQCRPARPIAKQSAWTLSTHESTSENRPPHDPDQHAGVDDQQQQGGGTPVPSRFVRLLECCQRRLVRVLVHRLKYYTQPGYFALYGFGSSFGGSTGR